MTSPEQRVNIYCADCSKHHSEKIRVLSWFDLAGINANKIVSVQYYAVLTSLEPDVTVLGVTGCGLLRV